MPPAPQQPTLAFAEPARKVLTVSQVTRQVKSIVEQRFGGLWIEGEVTGFKRHASGHWYFSLRDAGAVISAVVWRSSAERIRFEPADGLEVIAFGRLSVYEPQGKYQLYIDRLEPKGIGAAELAFRQLCDRLREEGLFEADRKRPLPAFPRRLALVTSADGAAVRDMIQVLRRRCPVTSVLVVPVRVQGDGAAAEIASAIRYVNKWADRLGGIELLIVGRGGGAREDLAAFNDEGLARAIAGSQLPVVSAVGHETDVTLADLVADRRALTPTEAAERAVPVIADIVKGLGQRRRQLDRVIDRMLERAGRRVAELGRRRCLNDPRDRLLRLGQRLDELQDALERGTDRRLRSAADRLGAAAAGLEALSPLRVLARGYALVRKADTGAVVRRADETALGDVLSVQLGEGRVNARVIGEV